MMNKDKNKDKYKSAMSKIEASEEFKSRVKSSIETGERNLNRAKGKSWIPALVVLIFIGFISTTVLSSLWKGNDERNLSSDKRNSSEEFKIIESNSDIEACYTSAVYIDGYFYSTSEWLTYSYGAVDDMEYDEIRGNKLGEVTLDLKGKRYVGKPPNFSSTLDLGTEIYEIKNIKKERAVLVGNGDMSHIYYRLSKIVVDEKEPINLTVSEVFNMLSNTPKVSSVELRSEEDGSWMRTSENTELLSLINNELSKVSLLNSYEVKRDGNGYNKRIPINLMFKDGTALHMQVYPEVKYATVFGGYVPISEELCREIEKLLELGDQYERIPEKIPYDQEQVSYLYFMNHITGVDVLCKDPKWSTSALFGMLKRYSVEDVKEDIQEKGTLIMSGTIGKSKEDSVDIDFYEIEDEVIVIKIKEDFYKPVKGRITYEQLNEYLYGFTGLGAENF